MVDVGTLPSPIYIVDSLPPFKNMGDLLRQEANNSVWQPAIRFPPNGCRGDNQIEKTFAAHSAKQQHRPRDFTLLHILEGLINFIERAVA